MTNDITNQLRPILQSALSGNRNWLPNHVYAGVVQEILGNGSIAVLINNKVYQATTHIPVRSGDLLNLRLLGTMPQPHFAIACLLDDAQRATAAAVQNSPQPTAAMFGRLNPGIEGLATLLLQYPEQLGRISPQLQPLLTAVAGNALAAADIARPGKLKRHVQNSGFFYDRHEVAGVEPVDADLKGLLLRLLGVLQHKRTLTLLNGRPGFIENQASPKPARLASSLAAYAAQDDNALARDFKNILTQNAETTLLQIVSSQLAARDKTTDTDRAFLMNLMIAHEETCIPLELELRQRVLPESEYWEAAFTIDLPVSGKMRWTITVKNPSVSVQVSCNDEATHGDIARQSRILDGLMAAQNLTLSHFSCIGMGAL